MEFRPDSKAEIEMFLAFWREASYMSLGDGVDLIAGR
jgi:hypothetical protein